MTRMFCAWHNPLVHSHTADSGFQVNHNSFKHANRKKIGEILKILKSVKESIPLELVAF